jgi:hypothetical protein
MHHSLGPVQSDLFGRGMHKLALSLIQPLFEVHFVNINTFYLAPKSDFKSPSKKEVFADFLKVPTSIN